MKTKGGVIFSLVLFAVVFMLAAQGVRAAGNIVITEIAAFEPEPKEWVEIFNRSSGVISVEGWKFWENDTNHGLALAKGAWNIAPQSYAVIADDAAEFLAQHPDVETVFDSSWGSLKESGEPIALKDASSTVIETFTYINASEAALQRLDAAQDAYDSSNWVEASSTPGAAYMPFPVPPPVPFPETPQGDQNEPKPTESAPATLPAPKDYPYMSVVLNEIYSWPDAQAITPELKKEWIELKSYFHMDLQMDSWIIKDGSGQRVKLTGRLPAYGITLAGFERATLNNSGDAVYLLDPTGKIIDAVEYGDFSGRPPVPQTEVKNVGAPGPGESLARKILLSFSGNPLDDFAITLKPTPLGENIIVGRSTASLGNGNALSSGAGGGQGNATSTLTTSTPAGSATSADFGATPAVAANASSSVTTLKLEEINETVLGTKVLVSGFVLVVPGILGERIIYIADEDTALQVYKHAKDFPKLKAGQYVRVVGEVSKALGEYRIKIKNKNDVSIMEAPLKKVRPQSMQLIEIGSIDSPAYVFVRGTVTEKKGRVIYIDDGTGEVGVSVRGNIPVEMKKLRLDTDISAVGILRVVNGEPRVYVVHSKDINIIEDDSAKEESVKEAKEDQSGVIKEPPEKQGLFTEIKRILTELSVALKNKILL